MRKYDLVDIHRGYFIYICPACKQWQDAQSNENLIKPHIEDTAYFVQDNCPFCGANLREYEWEDFDKANKEWHELNDLKPKRKSRKKKT